MRGKTMLFLEYPPCSTCKKARAWLDGHGLSYDARHIKDDNPSYEELKAWYEKSGWTRKWLPLRNPTNDTLCETRSHG